MLSSWRRTSGASSGRARPRTAAARSSTRGESSSPRRRTRTASSRPSSTARHMERIRRSLPVAREPPARRVHVARPRSSAPTRACVEAVLFDVDFTLAKPGPLLGPEGYRAAGARHGLDARPRALRGGAEPPPSRTCSTIPSSSTTRRSGSASRRTSSAGWAATATRVREVAEEITAGWLHSENFELYEDVLPVLAALREAGLTIGLVSNTSRDLAAFVRHFALDVDAWISSGVHGKVKPSPTIFRAALELLERRARGGGHGRRLAARRRRGRAARSACGPTSSTARAASRSGTTRCRPSSRSRRAGPPRPMRG